MADLSFDDFYTEILPFCQKASENGRNATKKKDGRQSDLRNELDANAADSRRLSVRVLGQMGLIAAIENTVGIVLPNSPRVKRLVKKATLRTLDCELGIRQHQVAPLTMARDLPESVRTEQFANYARSLSLPYIARIIETAVRQLPPTAPTPQG